MNKKFTKNYHSNSQLLPKNLSSIHKKENKNFSRQNQAFELFYLGRDILGYDQLTRLHLEWFDIISRYKKLLFLAPRDHLKTTCFSKTYPIYKLLKNRDLRILLINEILGNAKKFLREIKAHFQQNEKFINCFGHLDALADKWNEEEILIPRNRISGEPSISVAGVEQAIISTHRDLIMIDDPVSDKNCQTATQREKVKRWLQKTVIPILAPNGQIVVVGNRWHIRDLYSDILEDRDFKGWKKVVLSAEDREGNILFPERFPRQRLDDKKFDMGTANYATQYLNDPSATIGLVFAKEWLKYFPSAPENMSNYQGVDLAISRKEQGHYFVVATIGLDKEGNVWILDIYRDRISFPSQVKAIKRENAYHKPYLIAIESNAYQEALPETLRTDPESKRLPFRSVTAQGDKVRRISSLSPLFENGTIRLVKGEWNHEFEQEYLQFPKGSSDDILDALHIAVEGAKHLFRKEVSVTVAGE